MGESLVMSDQINFFVVLVDNKWVVWEMTDTYMNSLMKQDPSLYKRLDGRPFENRADAQKRSNHLNSRVTA